ncbi:MAG: endonuclease III [Endomicrobium sp.]|jgi:endonuclease-3|nr:endonuclease III [Endomicrobium sp.]
MMISKALKCEYALNIIKKLEKHFGNAKCTLHFSSVFELLVAVILSAQCTDERVNKITKVLFKSYKSIKDYAQADVLELERYIRTAGFFRNKAKNIIKTAQMIIDIYNGTVPQTMKELLKFPGVGQKTANVVLGSGFGKPEGITVDTHVIRIANLLKLTNHKNPVKIETDLMKIIPKDYWIKFPIYIQTMGRKICKAKKPNHMICPLNEICLAIKLS